MEKAKAYLKLTDQELQSVSELVVPRHKVNVESSFYEDFALRGLRVDTLHPGFVSCTFKVPPRLTDRTGKMAVGAIMNLVDEVGASVIHVQGLSMDVSTDMSVSCVGFANVDDELEVSSRLLGQKGGYFGIQVLVKNKASGEVIAEGRHSLFRKSASKL